MTLGFWAWVCRYISGYHKGHVERVSPFPLNLKPQQHCFKAFSSLTAWKQGKFQETFLFTVNTNNASPSFQWLKHQPFILIYVTYMFRVSWFEFCMSPHSGTQAGRIAPKWKHTISLKYFAQIWYLADLFKFYCSKYVIDQRLRSQRQRWTLFP